MVKRLLSLLVCIVGLTLIPCISSAAAPFYEGKTIRILVGYSPGGGYDAYSRLIARHLGKHIPGNPTVIVENMPGAGSLIAANHLYRVAKPDGLTIANFNGGHFFGQIFGQPGIEFDARKFEFIAAPGSDDVAFVLTKASGITSIEKWMASKTPVKLGGTAPGTHTPNNAIRIVEAALGLPIQLVSGYKGTAEIRLAAESGELAGSAWWWESIKATWRKGIDAGEILPVLQAVPKPLLDLPKIPLAINLAKTEEARQLIEIGIHGGSIVARPYVLPPGTPKDRVEILRKAFQETFKDKECIAEGEKAKLPFSPVTAEELERVIAGLFKLDPSLVAKLKEITSR
jgi:tripartite-type tricarboxylate transporter receptor subunit TctC